MRINLGSIASSIRDKFVDTFNRADTTGELGAASDGSLWNALRGVMQVGSNKAGSPSGTSTYPAASVKMPKTDVTISLAGTGNGAGSLLWVTDSGNWWATDIYQYTYSQNWYYNQATGNYTCTTYSSAKGCDISTANYSKNCVLNGYCCAVCNAWNSNNIKNAAYCKTYSYTGTYSCTYSVAGYNCVAPYYYNVCNAGNADYTTVFGGTYYYYPTYVRVLQSVANTVSTVANWSFGDSVTIQSLKTLISGNQITVKAYSDTNLTTQIGSDLVYTATGATVTAEYGIVLTPSGSNTVNTIDSVTIE